MLEIQANIIYNEILKSMHDVFGKGVTFQNDLDSASKKLFKKNYLGTFSSDQIPILKNKQMCIANLDKSYQGGSHWVGIYNDNGNNVIYDSFGRKNKQILPDFHKPNSQTDPDPEQKVKEEDCGSRALAWLIFCNDFGIKNGKLI